MLKFQSKNEIFEEAVRLSKESEDSYKCLDFNFNSKIIQYSLETKKIDINSKFENLALNFIKRELSSFSSLEEMFHSGLNFDFNLIKSYFSVYKGLFKKIDEIDNINKYLEENLRIKEAGHDTKTQQDLVGFAPRLGLEVEID